MGKIHIYHVTNKAKQMNPCYFNLRAAKWVETYIADQIPLCIQMQDFFVVTNFFFYIFFLHYLPCLHLINEGNASKNKHSWRHISVRRCQLQSAGKQLNVTFCNADYFLLSPAVIFISCQRANTFCISKHSVQMEGL